MRIINSCVA